MLGTVSALIGLSFGGPSPALQVASPAEPPAVVSIAPQGVLEARKGTRFLVDTKENMGYLLHTDGTTASFRVATGRTEDVRYLGMKYNAATPEAQWTVKSRTIQSDRITFGPEGRFLRLYLNGDQYTHYGIHDYAYLQEILEKPAEERYFSMGCVLVPPNILDILEDIYELNNGSLEVTTMHGLKTAVIAQKS